MFSTPCSWMCCYAAPTRSRTRENTDVLFLYAAAFNDKQVEKACKVELSPEAILHGSNVNKRAGILNFTQTNLHPKTSCDMLARRCTVVLALCYNIHWMFAMLQWYQDDILLHFLMNTSPGRIMLSSVASLHYSPIILHITQTRFLSWL